jgi:hypothetical protein
MNGFLCIKCTYVKLWCTCGFSRVLRHSNSNNTFISIVFVFFGTPCIYHNTIIYPVCIMFFLQKTVKSYISCKQVNLLMILRHYTRLYNTIQCYTRLYNTIYKAIRDYTTLYSVIQDYTTLHKSIQHLRHYTIICKAIRHYTTL